MCFSSHINIPANHCFTFTSLHCGNLRKIVAKNFTQNLTVFDIEVFTLRNKGSKNVLSCPLRRTLKINVL